MTTETRIIVRPAPDALRAAGPTKPHADAPTPSGMEEMPPAPASKKHSGAPEAAKDASASKKPADTTANETPASTKHAKAADAAKKLPASKKPKVAATKAKVKAKTPASPKPTRKTKKVAASSKPAPKKPVTKKPAAKQLPKKKGPTKESQKALELPPKRTAVLLPDPHEEVSSDSSDTDVPNPGYVSGADSPVPRTRASAKDNAASANDATTSPPGRTYSFAASILGSGLRGVGARHGPRGRRGRAIAQADHGCPTGSPSGEPHVSQHYGGGGTCPTLGGVPVSPRRPARFGVGSPSHHQCRCRRGSSS
ncbi:hypothetical protein PF008_g130 [Phytophthora fragariae]|uniref:Uncharacterized protein n=1 Tax=Phytophthora fragariae TaxID=53985 RepID=A0A6G0SP23_9STRA|nr:hypothetical protein PF008_g130 [Phytophthora fragariae]